MNNSKLVLWGFLDSVGVLVYTLLIGYLVLNIGAVFGSDPGLMGPAFFLMLAAFSVLVMGLLVLGRPIWMYLNKQKKGAAKLLVFTVIFLLVMIAGMAGWMSALPKLEVAPTVN